MSIKRHLIVIVLAVHMSFLAMGQESYLYTCRKYPDSDNLIEKINLRYISESKTYVSRGDISGLELCIRVMSELNTFDLPLANADIYKQKGILSYYNYNNSDALSYYLDAIKIYREAGYNEGINTLLNNIAIVFSRVEDYESTLKYLEKALDYTDPADISTYSLFRLNIAETESDHGRTESSLATAFDLYNNYDSTKVDYSIISVTGVIIKNYNQTGNFEEATRWIEKSYPHLSPRTGFIDLMSFCTPAMETYLKLGQFEKVIGLGSMIYPPPEEAFTTELYRTLDLLLRANIELGHYTEAVKIEEKLTDIEFSKTSYSREELVTLLMTDYAFNLDNLTRINLEKELELNREKDRAQKKFLTSFLFALLVISILTIIFTRLRKKRRISRAELSEENNKLANINRELSASNQMLEKENNLLDTLISVFAHDLINPFQAILGFSRLMVNDFDNIDEENIVEYTSLLSDTSFQLNQLLINLKNMAVLQDENRHLESSLFDIDPVLTGVINLFSPAARKKEIEIKYSGGKELKGYINSDIYQSVIRNIISNAVKFSHEKGIIEITTETSGNYTVTRVTDHGTGMPAQIREKLLDHEFLMSSPGTLKEKGSGLGLSISIELLELYNGIMEISSEEGKGTSVSVKIKNSDEKGVE